MWRHFLTLWNYHLVWSARIASIAREWASSALSSVRERRFGKLFSWTFILAILATVGDFLKLGFNQTIDLFRGVAGSASLTQGGNLLQWASQSLQPVQLYLQNICPEFWRWLGYWMGLDWLVWAFVCGVIFSFSGWLLSVLVKALASVIRIAFEFL